MIVSLIAHMEYGHLSLAQIIKSNHILYSLI